MAIQHQRKHRKYTLDDLHQITAMVEAGCGRQEIGKVMDRHKDSIGGAIQRYGLPKPDLRRKVPAHIVLQIKELWFAGWTGGEIAKKIGKTRSAVHGIIDRNGYKGRVDANAPTDAHGYDTYKPKVTLATFACLGGGDGRTSVSIPSVAIGT